MNLVIDAGNTRLKAASFEGRTLRHKHSFDHLGELVQHLQTSTFAHVLVSSVSYDAAEILQHVRASEKKLILTSSLSLPITNRYATPATLGVDRIAAVCGAFDLYPNTNCLVIDAGTCITYEFLDAAGVYHGGAISPGIAMRFEAMHTFTARLPLVAADEDARLVGNSTETSMQSGVIHGVIAEVDGIIERYRSEYPDLRVILCGGDSTLFEKRAKQAIFVAPDLVLSGLNRILRHHAEF